MTPVPGEEVRWMEHRGVKILVVSYGRCRNAEQMLAVLAEQVAQVHAAGAKVRVLHDYREAFWGERFVEESKRLSKAARETAFERVALVGLVGVKKALFQSYRLFTGDHSSRAFDTLEAALDWLAS